MFDKKKAHLLGARSFATGYIRRPAVDPEFVEMLNNGLAEAPILPDLSDEKRMPRVKAVADAVTAWINGYDEANIAAYRSDLVHVPEDAVLMIEWSSLGRRCTLRRET